MNRTIIQVPDFEGKLHARDVVIYDRTVDFRDQMRRGSILGASLPFFDQILVKDFLFSIQASEFHYCTPRINQMNARNYLEFEVMIFRMDNKAFNIPRNLPLFSRFEANNGPAGWVNAEDLTEMLNFVLDNPEALAPVPALNPAPPAQLTGEVSDEETASHVRAKVLELITKKLQETSDEDLPDVAARILVAAANE